MNRSEFCFHKISTSWLWKKHLCNKALNFWVFSLSLSTRVLSGLSVSRARKRGAGLGRSLSGWVRQTTELWSELEEKLHSLCCLFHFHYLICYVSALCCSLLFCTASVCNMGQNICLNQWQPSATPPLIM